MDAGYISLRLEAVSLETAHQDDWQVRGRELDRLRRRRAGLTIHFLLKVKTCILTWKPLTQGEKNISSCLVELQNRWQTTVCSLVLFIQKHLWILFCKCIAGTSSPAFKSVNSVHEWLGLMYHYSLSLCRDPLNWLTDLNRWNRKLPIRGNLWLTLHSVISPTFSSSCHRRQVSLKFEEKASWLLSILYFSRSISLYLVLSDHPVIHYYLRVSLRVRKAHSTFVFSSRTCSTFCNSAAWKSHLLHKDVSENAVRPCISMICTYSSQLSGLFVLVQHSQVCVSSALNGCQGTQGVRWGLFQQSCSEPFVFMWRYCERNPDSFPHFAFFFFNLTWAEWSLIDLPASPKDLLRSTGSLWCCPTV